MSNPSHPQAISRQEKESLVLLGECRGVHGIKGEFSFRLENTENSSLKKGSFVYLIPEASSQLEEGVYQLASIRFGNKVIAKLAGCHDRNTAESYLPFSIYIDRSSLPELEQDEFYLRDLLECEVLDSKTRKIIGKIWRFYSCKQQETVCIRLNNGKKIELPLVENFFPHIDIEKKQVVMNKPEFID